MSSVDHLTLCVPKGAVGIVDSRGWRRQRADSLASCSASPNRLPFTLRLFRFAPVDKRVADRLGVIVFSGRDQLLKHTRAGLAAAVAGVAAAAAVVGTPAARRCGAGARRRCVVAAAPAVFGRLVAWRLRTTARPALPH